MIRILRASHIKPWRISSDIERLDMYNGLLLLPSIDSLFDAGLITFSEEGHLVKSVFFEFYDDKQFGLPKKASIKLKKEHRPYLAYHTEKVFVG